MLYDFVFVLLPVLELAPQVLGVGAVLLAGPGQGNACPSRAGDGLDDPDVCLTRVAVVVVHEHAVVVQDKQQQPIVYILVLYP